MGLSKQLCLIFRIFTQTCVEIEPRDVGAMLNSRKYLINMTLSLFQRKTNQPTQYTNIYVKEPFNLSLCVVDPNESRLYLDLPSIMAEENLITMLP